MADTFECPSCALQVEGDRSDYDRCPYCNYEFPEQKTSIKAVAILLVVLMIFFALYLAV